MQDLHRCAESVEIPLQFEVALSNAAVAFGLKIHELSFLRFFHPDRLKNARLKGIINMENCQEEK